MAWKCERKASFYIFHIFCVLLCLLHCSNSLPFRMMPRSAAGRKLVKGEDTSAEDLANINELQQSWKRPRERDQCLHSFRMSEVIMTQMPVIAIMATTMTVKTVPATIITTTKSTTSTRSTATITWKTIALMTKTSVTSRSLKRFLGHEWTREAFQYFFKVLELTQSFWK